MSSSRKKKKGHHTMGFDDMERETRITPVFEIVRSNDSEIMKRCRYSVCRPFLPPGARAAIILAFNLGGNVQ